MILELRTYRHGVNRLSDAFDYLADFTSRTVAADMLEDAIAVLDEAENRPMPASQGGGMRPLIARSADAALARLNVTLLRGALAEADAALASYPAEVREYAEQRFDF